MQIFVLCLSDNHITYIELAFHLIVKSMITKFIFVGLQPKVDTHTIAKYFVSC